jgi:hypothetical protein
MSAWRIGVESGVAPSPEEAVRTRRRRSRRSRERDTRESAQIDRDADVNVDRASAAGGGQFAALVDRVVKWIPGDTLALYVPGVTLLAAREDEPEPSAGFLLLMILVTPLFVVGAAFAGGRMSLNGWLRVVVSAVLAAVAFMIWSLSVPFGGWQRWDLVADNAGEVAIGAAIAAVLFAFLAEGVVRRLPSDP